MRRERRTRLLIVLVVNPPFLNPSDENRDAPFFSTLFRQVGQWTSSMVEVCLKRLTGLNKPFKYVVTCVIMQKNGAGLHTASSCYWDNTTDGEW